jgi:hypothetical protein
MPKSFYLEGGFIDEFESVEGEGKSSKYTSDGVTTGGRALILFRTLRRGSITLVECLCTLS